MGLWSREVLLKDVATLSPLIIDADVSKIVNSVNKQSDDYRNAYILMHLPASIIYSIMSQLSADKAQSILYKWVESLTKLDRLIDLITFNASDVTLSSNVTYSGVNRFLNLNLNGYVYTADGQPHVIIANSISIPSASRIDKTASGGAGGAGYGGAGSGGTGGGGLYIIARSIDLRGSINANGANGGNGGTYTAQGPGSPGGSGVLPNIERLGIANGGGGGGPGDPTTVGACGGGGGPNGPGGVGYEPGGNGGSVTTVSYTVEGLISNILKAAVDWWLVNVLGKTPTSTTSFPNLYNAGGGGGGAMDVVSKSTGGGGGGGGGVIIVIALLIKFYGTINAKGGSGGGGSGNYGYSGGAGGGGYVLLAYSKGFLWGNIYVSGASAGVSITYLLGS